MYDGPTNISRSARPAQGEQVAMRDMPASVQFELATLEKTVGELQDVFKQLNARIEPVLRPDPPRAVGEKGPTNGDVSPLAHKLSHTSDTLAELVSDVRVLIQRVDC